MEDILQQVKGNRMRRKLLSLALALAMCLGLATVAMAAEVSSGKCTYELSNDPIKTVNYRFEEHDWVNGGSMVVDRS